MLILTRRPQEKIFIGDGNDQVEIIVTGIAGGQVRLGFNAPKHVKIDREEVRNKTKERKFASARKRDENFGNC